MGSISYAVARAPISTAAFLCLLAGACAIAFAPIFVRLADVGPVASAFWRCALAVPLLWMWIAMPPSPGDSAQLDAGGALSPKDRGEGHSYAPILILAGLFFAADLGVWHFSIVYTSVANSTLLANLAPIVVTLDGWLVWRRPVTRTFLAGMVVSIAGMFVLVGPNFSAGGTRLLGDALGALTAVFYGSYMLAVKAARDAGASTARVMAWSTTITAFVLLPLALIAPQPFLPAGATGWWGLAGLALVTQVLGQGLIAYAFGPLPAPLWAVSRLLHPVMGAP